MQVLPLRPRDRPPAATFSRCRHTLRQKESQRERGDAQSRANSCRRGGAVPERQCRAGSDRVNVERAKQHGADDSDPDGISDALHRADHSTGCASVRRRDRRDDEIGVGRNEQAASDPGDQKRTAWPPAPTAARNAQD
jgi:hypothetical protein